MRDKLKATTISRDYVDSILSSMNDALIVTSSDGRIKRINKATSHMLGYEEAELLGMSIDHIVNAVKSGSLVDQKPSGLPHEARKRSPAIVFTPRRTSPSGGGPRNASVTSRVSMP